MQNKKIDEHFSAIIYNHLHTNFLQYINKLYLIKIIKKSIELNNFNIC